MRASGVVIGINHIAFSSVQKLGATGLSIFLGLNRLSSKGLLLDFEALPTWFMTVRSRCWRSCYLKFLGGGLGDASLIV